MPGTAAASSRSRPSPSARRCRPRRDGAGAGRGTRLRPVPGAGSSLTVYPAAGFPLLAKENGATLAIVNRERTPQDSAADLVLHDEIGRVLAAAVPA